MSAGQLRVNDGGAASGAVSCKLKKKKKIEQSTMSADKIMKSA